ncbi:SMI1/KNR4 family protein [Microbacterium sp.]|uniref:SMI1/KNR4 family protein n=1 Tax=Microbacterium sp. TaxID=51671 RepID=UPI0034456391
MLDGLENYLTAVEDGLRQLDRWKLIRSLRPGASPSQVLERFRSAGTDVPIEALELFSWHDGTETRGTSIGEIALIPGFYLLSSTDSTENYRAFVSDERWRPSWIPFLADGGGDFYVLDSEGRDRVAPIRRFRIEEQEHPVEFGSLKDFFETISVAFQRGVFFVDESGFLEMDDFAFAELARQINPGIPWWSEPV